MKRPARALARLGPFGGPRGAKEYQQPFHIYRTGDSVVIADWQMRRSTLWSLDGKMLGAIPAVDGLRGALPRARDGAGHRLRTFVQAIRATKRFERAARHRSRTFRLSVVQRSAVRNMLDFVESAPRGAVPGG